MADADDLLPRPEPKEIDEKKALELRHMAEDAVLKGVPYGDEKCGNCLILPRPGRQAGLLLAPQLGS